MDRPRLMSVQYFILSMLLSVYTTAADTCTTSSEALSWQLTGDKLAELQELWAKYGPDYNEYRKTIKDYPCEALPKSAATPTSVHYLRPGDINVVGAMGDSLTAGTGIKAKNIFGVLTQNRGLSWSGGGQTTYEEQITMPNILKKYNPNVYGFAIGDGKEDSKNSIFNVAVSGSKSQDLVSQARMLIDRMKNDPKVNFTQDWKIVTVFSGNNDLCDFCKECKDLTADNFRKNTMAALDLLHAEMPRTLVNLVEPINVEIVTQLNKGVICSALHFFLCDCAAFPDNEEAEKKVVAEADMYQTIVDEIATSGRYDTRDDFTVVVQPFNNKTYLPMRSDGQPDLSYFAPDCFHFSEKGQAAAASGLWNNMIEPMGSKRTKWSPGEEIECPSKTTPFIYTNKNSKPGFFVSSFKDPALSSSHVAKLTRPALQNGSTQDGTPISAVGIVAIVAGVIAALAVVAVIAFKTKQKNNSYSPI